MKKIVGILVALVIVLGLIALVLKVLHQNPTQKPSIIPIGIVKGTKASMKDILFWI
ncbi:hypothetical protein P4534_24270 [Peribacillus butanolivorans]|uniref:hypothetical protein n=1 Tax=Peribacillus butanolivorans TaxID=421767 RepID=UPI002E24DB38|nr:hypothetical protein [Peribacillus butanolivorans]